MKNVMSRAWEIAREAVKAFGGSVKSFFAEALRMAWAEVKSSVATILVKEWKAEQINEECHKFHWVLVRTDRHDGTYALNLTAPIIRETEKAVYVSVEACTYGESYREFKCWIPKSCIA